MVRSFLPGFGRSVATASMWVGIVLFSLCVIAGARILMEGVTHRVGEGNVVAPESPEDVQFRLVVTGWLVAGVVVGWALARLGEAFRRPKGEGSRLQLARLGAELLLLLGSAGVAIGILIAWGNQLAAYQVGDDYHEVGIGGAVVGVVLVAAGWLLLRWSRPEPEVDDEPDEPDDEADGVAAADTNALAPAGPPIPLADLNPPTRPDPEPVVRPVAPDDYRPA